MKVLITEKLSEHRYRTPEGYLVCVDAILARTGKQVYKHNQVYDGSTDEITDIEVDRKPEQVFSPQAIASFENKPLTIQHPNEPVTVQNHKELYHGFARDIRRAVKRNGQILTGSKRPTQLQDGDQELLVGNIIVTTSEAIEEIDNGLEFLSCGYDCDITQTDAPEQINIRGNHVALCDNPRAGITMLQDNVDLLELPMKHIVKVLTDAVIEQANKVRMNDDLSKFNAKLVKKVEKYAATPAMVGGFPGPQVKGMNVNNLNEAKEAILILKAMNKYSNSSYAIARTSGKPYVTFKDSIEDEGSIVNTRIWNPDFYLKKETGYEEAKNTIRKVLQNSGLTVEEVTLSIYGSVIRFTKNMKLDANQTKSFISQQLAKINSSLKVEKFRSMAGKCTFEITGYEYLKKHLKDADNVVEWKTYEELGKKLRQLGFADIRVRQIMEALQDGKPVKNVGNLTFKRVTGSIEDAINYVVMCEQLYNGSPVKSRAPWIVFRSEDKRKAEQFVKENNAKTKSLVGFSKHYYIK